MAEETSWGDDEARRVISHDILERIDGIKPRRDLELATGISLRHGYVYFRVSKCASSTVTFYLQQKEFEGSGFKVQDINNKYVSPHLSPYQLSEADFVSLLTDPGIRKITFVRHPFARLLSCYLHRIIGQRNTPSVTYFRKCFPNAPEELTFRAFVERVCDQTSREMDRHWRVQSDESLYSLIDYHFVGKFETLGQDLLTVGRLLFPDGLDVDPAQLVNKSPMTTGSRTRIREYFTDDLMARVRRRFAADFDNFGYSADTW